MASKQLEGVCECVCALNTKQKQQKLANGSLTTTTGHRNGKRGKNALNKMHSLWCAGNLKIIFKPIVSFCFISSPPPPSPSSHLLSHRTVSSRLTFDLRRHRQMYELEFFIIFVECIELQTCMGQKKNKAEQKTTSKQRPHK